MNEQLLNAINRNLYDVESLISTKSVIDALEKYNIDVKLFSQTIELYISNFDLLKKVKKDNNLLTLLNEKLIFFIGKAESLNSIEIYRMQLDASINFIEKQSSRFFSDTIDKDDDLSNSKKISSIDLIKIKDFFSIKYIKLENLKDKEEIYIVGENGDGKTLLLQAITIALTGIKEGDIFNFIKSQKKYNLSIVDSNQQYYGHDSNNLCSNIFAYGASRNSYCQMKEDKVGYLTLFKGEYDLKNSEEWLINLFNAEKSSKRNIISLNNAKKLLQKLLNKDIEIEVTYNKVTFKEKSASVSFDQLSAGYKGVITIICDLISRLSVNQPNVENITKFQGVVLIDEIELHLHPKWKYNFMKKLRDTFPLIQFIVTTHSPTVILGASKEAVFYKIYKDDGKVQISNQIANEGYTHNSLVSSPLFDLESITSRDYKKNTSSSDYVYEKIHDVIAQKLRDNIDIDENKLYSLIDKELEKL